MANSNQKKNLPVPTECKSRRNNYGHLQQEFKPPTFTLIKISDLQINLLVIRSKIPDDLVQQYEQLGMEFNYHKHGNGPYHYAAEFNGLVFEIYQQAIEEPSSEIRIRLGFEVVNIEAIINLLSNTKWIIVKPIKASEYGKFAVIQDLDGRKIELKEK